MATGMETLKTFKHLTFLELVPIVMAFDINFMEITLSSTQTRPWYPYLTIIVLNQSKSVINLGP